MDDVFDKVKEVIVQVMKIDGDSITPETRIVEDLKADSMDKFFLVDGINQKFDITIPDEEAKNFKTIGDVVKFLEKK